MIENDIVSHYWLSVLSILSPEILMRNWTKKHQGLCLLGKPPPMVCNPWRCYFDRKGKEQRLPSLSRSLMIVVSGSISHNAVPNRRHQLSNLLGT